MLVLTDVLFKKRHTLLSPKRNDFGLNYTAGHIHKYHAIIIHNKQYENLIHHSFLTPIIFTESRGFQHVAPS